MFGRNLTPEQQAEVQQSAETLNALCLACEQAYQDLRPRVTELYMICRALRQSLTPPRIRRVESFWRNLNAMAAFGVLVGGALAVVGLIVGVVTAWFAVLWIGLILAGIGAVGVLLSLVAAWGIGKMRAEEVLERFEWGEISAPQPSSDDFRQLDLVANWPLWKEFLESGQVSLDHVGHLVGPAQDAIRIYTKQLRDSQEIFLSLPPEDWYPRGFRKAYDSWALYFEGRLWWVSSVDEALQPPVPLKREPGKDRLNVFVSGLDLLATFKPGAVFPVR